MMKKNTLNKIIGIAKKIYPFFLSVLLGYIVFLELEKTKGLNELFSINYKIIVVSVLIFGIVKIFNTFRYALTYGLKNSIELFLMLSYCNFLLNIIPFRLGEISYVHYIEKKYNIKKATCLNKLILIRFFDYIVVYLLFLLSSLYVSNQVDNSIIWYISIFFIISLLFFLFLIIASLVFIKQKNKFKNIYIIGLINYLINVKNEIQNVNKKTLFGIFIFTLFYWFSRIALGYIAMIMLPLNISFPIFIFASMLFLLISMLPIHTFLGVGIFEGGWSYFLVAFGYSYEEILPKIITYHIVLLFPVIVYGLLGYLLQKIIQLTHKTNHNLS